MKLTLNQCLLSYIDNRGITPTKLHGEFSETITEHRVLSANNVKSCGLVRLSEVRFVDDDLYKKWMDDEIEKGDILLTSEAPAGEVYFWDSDEKIVVGQRLYALRVNTSLVNPLWLSYYLQSPKGQADIQHNTTGSTVFGISQKTFDNIVIDIPDISTQNKIANILYAIDNQIQRNQDMCHKLQVLAQTTYSRWFNQFEFPNEHGLPYKSSGGKMGWNDELKREIPDDWKVMTLGDLLLKNTEKINNTNGIDTIDLSVMPSDNFVLNELNKSDNFTTNLFKMHRGDLMFGSIRPYLHKAGIAPCDGAFAGTVHSFCVRNNNDYNLCLCALTSKDMFSFAVKKSKGTKMPVISSSDLLRYKMPYSEQISKQFTELLDIRDIVCNCVMQNNILKSIKCKLLPLFINGQINL